MRSYVSLREVVEKNTGTQNPQQKPDEIFWYIDVGSVDNKHKKIVGAKRLIGTEAPSRARKLVKENDILVSTVRPNLNAVSMVPNYLDAQVASTGFCVLRAKPTILPEYLFFFVCSQGFVQSLSSLVAGALYPAVTDAQVLDQQLPLPSLTQQRRLVDILTRAESIVRLRREALKKAQEIIPALFVDMFGDPATNPKGWPTLPLSKVAPLKSGFAFKSSDYQQDGVRLVRISNLQDGTLTFEKDSPRLPQKHVERYGEFLLYQGDVLVAMSGATTGKLAVAPEIKEPMLLNQRVGKFFIHTDKMDGEYLFSLLNNQGINKILVGEAAGAAQPNVSPKAVGAIVVPIPPLNLQQEFASKITQIRSIQSQATRALATAEATFQSLLHRAFAGEI